MACKGILLTGRYDLAKLPICQLYRSSGSRRSGSLWGGRNRDSRFLLYNLCSSSRVPDHPGQSRYLPSLAASTSAFLSPSTSTIDDASIARMPPAFLRQPDRLIPQFQCRSAQHRFGPSRHYGEAYTQDATVDFHAAQPRFGLDYHPCLPHNARDQVLSDVTPGYGCTGALARGVDF